MLGTEAGGWPIWTSNSERRKSVLPKKKPELSSEAKAEILASVIHAIEETPKVWNRLPKRIQRMILFCQNDCSIWHEDLTKKDVRMVKEWFKWFEEKKA
jgi:predicted oxidoreductase (fatty acid repression mutant protein)